MVQKDMSVYITDIIDAIGKIELYIAHTSFEDFITNTEKQDAVLRRLEIVGEAASRLTEAFKNDHAEVPWKKIIGLRNIIIHDYGYVDLEQIWAIVTEDLPATKHVIEKITV